MFHLALLLMFATAVTLHNLEEALWLPDWLRTHIKAFFDPDPRAYWVGTSLISLFVWIVALATAVWPAVLPFHLALSGIALVMAVNAVMPHLSMTLIRRSYMPGTATGMLFNLPLAVLLIHAQLRNCVVTRVYFWRQSILYAIVLGIVAFAGVAALHKIFERLPKHGQPR